MATRGNLKAKIGPTRIQFLRTLNCYSHAVQRNSILDCISSILTLICYQSGGSFKDTFYQTCLQGRCDNSVQTVFYLPVRAGRKGHFVNGALDLIVRNVVFCRLHEVPRHQDSFSSCQLCP